MGIIQTNPGSPGANAGASGGKIYAFNAITNVEETIFLSVFGHQDFLDGMFRVVVDLEFVVMACSGMAHRKTHEPQG